MSEGEIKSIDELRKAQAAAQAQVQILLITHTGNRFLRI